MDNKMYIYLNCRPYGTHRSLGVGIYLNCRPAGTHKECCRDMDFRTSSSAGRSTGFRACEKISKAGG